MNAPKGELARFLWNKCHDRLFTPVAAWVSQYPNSIEAYSRIEYPDAATLETLLIEFTTNVSVVDDTIKFDAVVSCEIVLEGDGRRDRVDETVTQWLRASCEVTVEEDVKRFAVGNITTYSRERNRQYDGRADNNLVPIIGNANLDDEATKFLERYCPEALKTPMPVPIEKIVRDEMHLTLINGGKLTDNLGVFGQICFSAGKVKSLRYFYGHRKRG